MLLAARHFPYASVEPTLLLDQQGQVMHHGPRAFEGRAWEMALTVQRIIDSNVRLIDANDHQGVSTCYPINGERVDEHNGIEPLTDLRCEFVYRQGMLPSVWKTQLAHGIHSIEGFRAKAGTVTERTHGGFR